MNIYGHVMASYEQIDDIFMYNYAHKYFPVYNLFLNSVVRLSIH